MYRNEGILKYTKSMTAITLAGLLGTGLAVAGANVAQAATYTYVNNKSAPENKVYYSGTRSSISGGSAATEPSSADGGQVEVTLETYRPAPGYQTISFNTGTGGNGKNRKPEMLLGMAVCGRQYRKPQIYVPCVRLMPNFVGGSF